MGVCQRTGPPAAAPTATESASATERCGSEAERAGEDAQGASSGRGPELEEMAGCCLDGRFRHLQWAGRPAPGWNDCQPVYEKFVRVFYDLDIKLFFSK